jgi:hypothetical protein
MTLWTSVVYRSGRAAAMLDLSDRMLGEPGSESETRHDATKGNRADSSVSARIPPWKETVPTPRTELGDHAGP